MFWQESAGPDYSSLMRNSMTTAAELLDSIEKDIQESRQLIYTKNADESALTALVSTLREDNELLEVLSCCYSAQLLRFAHYFVSLQFLRYVCNPWRKNFITFVLKPVATKIHCSLSLKRRS